MNRLISQDNTLDAMCAHSVRAYTDVEGPCWWCQNCDDWVVPAVPDSEMDHTGSVWDQ